MVCFVAIQVSDWRNRHRDVRFWHLADVPLELTNVCFEGKSGLDADVTRCLLLTQFRHRSSYQADRWRLSSNNGANEGAYSGGHSHSKRTPKGDADYRLNDSGAPCPGTKQAK